MPEIGISEPAEQFVIGRAAMTARHRRLVAVAVTPMELLRPESDLARLFEGAAHVDLLLACDDAPAAEPGPVGVLNYADYPDYDDDPAEDSDDDPAHAPAADRSPAAAAFDPIEDVRVAVADLALPELHLHRLGLRAPLGPQTEADLVAALSELIGFDPEPGVYCLAPAQFPPDPSRAVVDRAAQRIAQVYGIPLLRYRCLELSVVTS